MFPSAGEGEGMKDTERYFEHAGHRCAVRLDADWRPWAYVLLADPHPLLTLVQNGWCVAGFSGAEQWLQYGRLHDAAEVKDGHWWLGYPAGTGDPVMAAMALAVTAREMGEKMARRG